MQILQEIIEGAVSSDAPISGLLRKCLVMAYQLNNGRLKAWVDKELDGYANDEPIPEYRQVNAGAKGYFLGPYGAEIRNQPLPPAVLEPQHQHWASTLNLVQPIAAYELLVERSKTADASGEAVIEWPANLTARYQTKFIRGYTLNRAWQEIPHSSIVSLVDTVRNRVLRFALELRQELGDVSDDPTTLPAEKVDQYVTNYIFGGNNVFSGTTNGVTQIGNIVVAKGDLTGLNGASALAMLPFPRRSRIRWRPHAVASA